MKVIDADALKQEMLDCDDDDIGFSISRKVGLDEYTDTTTILEFWRECKKAFGNFIESQSTVDPEKHGHWIYVPYELADTREECSICHYHRILLGGKNKDYVAPNYCPECGTKMDEVTK